MLVILIAFAVLLFRLLPRLPFKVPVLANKPFDMLVHEYPYTLQSAAGIAFMRRYLPRATNADPSNILYISLTRSAPCFPFFSCVCSITEDVGATSVSL